LKRGTRTITILRRTYRFIIISILLFLTWLFVYLTSGTPIPTVHIFYFPIILSSMFWGNKGGIVVGVAAGILSGPLIPYLDSEDIPQSPISWFLRMFFFTFCGAFLGTFFSVLQVKKREILIKTQDLEAKNMKITAQRDAIIQQKNEIEKQRDEIVNKQMQLNEFGTGMVEALTLSIEVRDAYTSGHCQRVSDMAVRIGERMGIDDNELLNLKLSGTLHDIGKIGISEEILNKIGKLTPLEYEEMKQHPLLGAKILNGIPYAGRILDGVKHHHERLDGTGYPYGLSRDEIGLQARIIAISDVWDALTSKRAYRDALPLSEAMEIMETCRDSQFDPLVLDQFFKIIREDLTSK
jgi:HD-GYP domain-containing protein (c-di-GMP phosphodiesterase class II)